MLRVSRRRPSSRKRQKYLLVPRPTASHERRRRYHVRPASNQARICHWKVHETSRYTIYVKSLRNTWANFAICALLIGRFCFNFDATVSTINICSFPREGEILFEFVEKSQQIKASRSRCVHGHNFCDLIRKHYTDVELNFSWHKVVLATKKGWKVDSFSSPCMSSFILSTKWKFIFRSCVIS